MNTDIEDIYSIFKTINILSYKLNYNKLEKIGLYPGQPILLEKINENEGISQTELSKMALKQPATITVMLNKLEKSGYVKKFPDTKDRRIIRLYLTELGKMKYNEFIDVRKSMGDLLFNDITDEEIGYIYSILVRMKNNLEK